MTRRTRLQTRHACAESHRSDLEALGGLVVAGTLAVLSAVLLLLVL